jgi:hypothetical protein
MLMVPPVQALLGFTLYEKDKKPMISSAIVAQIAVLLSTLLPLDLLQIEVIDMICG